ncbi:MAG TPA: ATP-binding protein [Gemmataceae bacterium]|jgi:serine/threonine-protein kinase RsbW|nr:ATP-binding protein [Gemmataceae bacterium]
MASDSSPLTLTLPSDLRLLSVARTFVEAVCKVGGFDQATTDAIVLATNEATSNVIRHAHQGRPEAYLQIQCRFCSEGLEICLLDEGEPFDLTAVPHLNPAEIRVGGRGVFLMRRLMDELSCQAQGERGNVLRMVKHCGGKSVERGCG